MKTNTHFWSFLAQFFLERGIFHTKLEEKFRTPILYSITAFQNRTVYELMLKNNMVQSDRPQMTLQYGACTRLHTYTHSECVILIAFPRGIMVTRTRLYVTFIRKLPVIFYLKCKKVITNFVTNYYWRLRNMQTMWHITSSVLLLSVYANVFSRLQLPDPCAEHSKTYHLLMGFKCCYC